jgi:hypothetical protein
MLIKYQLKLTNNFSSVFNYKPHCTAKYNQTRLEPVNTLENFSQTKTSVVKTEVKMLMVAQVHSNWNDILAELSRWLQLNREATGLVYFTAAD